VLIRNDDPLASIFDVTGRSAVFVVDERGAVAWRHIAGTDALERQVEIAVVADALRDESPVSTTNAAEPTRSNPWSRREFVVTVFAATIALALEPAVARAERVVGTPVPSVGDPRPVTLQINGQSVALTLEPRVTLLDALREYAGLTGSKKGCDHGQCGACTVHVDGHRVLSCMTFAVMQQGKRITTIEGLTPTSSSTLHPMQQAFIEHDGFQCGYCTSGQIMSAVAMTREPWGPSDDDVREAMSGNICRCGAYPGIVAAVQDVRHNGGGRSGSGQ
jgi:xanthine dehydrogenase YagT iron-sulfur-binding subunit